jgi:nickel-dependent lactate racemase
MDMSEITLPYGEEERCVRVPSSQLAWVLSPRDVPGLPDASTVVRDALRHPIDSPSVTELAASLGDDVVILVDDNTRTTPQQVLLPPLLDELNRAGVPDRQIHLLIALGTHRSMTDREKRERYGDEVMARVQVENLDKHNPDAFLDMGRTASGIPVQVARRYAEATLRLAVGNIIPHLYAGWGGGAKMVQPGVCSALTTAHTHLMAGPRSLENLGRLDNPIRQEIDDIGQRTGLTFILNTVLNHHGQVVALVAGDPIAAHRQGVEIAQGVYGVQVPELVDIAVVSSHPADRDFWQGIKGLPTGELTVKPGGEVILLNPAPEGVAPDHPTVVELGVTPVEEVLAELEQNAIEDKVGAATYLAIDVLRSYVEVTVVSHPIGADDFRALGLNWRGDGQAALDEALARSGQDARVGFITHGADLLPLLD